MESSFDKAFERLMAHEGSYSNHPDDPGQETMFGVTSRVARAHGYTGPMNLLPRERAKAIAKSAYWDRIKADQYDGAIGFQVFDAAYNHGIENAVRFLQRAVGVADDGDLGPHTLVAIHRMPVTDVLARFNAERLEFYTKLSTWPQFGKGWARRIVTNLKYQVEDI
jgi:lysozyme family protein